MGMLGQMKDVYKLQSDAKKAQKELEKMHIEADESGVKVTINGKMEIVSVDIAESVDVTDRKALSSLLTKAFNRAMKKAQEVMQQKMAPMMERMQGLMGAAGQ